MTKPKTKRENMNVYRELKRQTGVFDAVPEPFDVIELRELRAENERLRGALEEIAKPQNPVGRDWLTRGDLQKLARQALTKEEK